MADKLTGKWRFRWATTGIIFKRSFLVMEVEVHRTWPAVYDDFHPVASSEAGSTTFWRDAIVADLSVAHFPTGGKAFVHG